jgi:hypothetical protein
MILLRYSRKYCESYLSNVTRYFYFVTEQHWWKEGAKGKGREGKRRKGGREGRGIWTLRCSRQIDATVCDIQFYNSISKNNSGTLARQLFLSA